MFVNEKLEPFEGLWAFLAGIERMSKAQVESIVREAEGRGRVIGVRMVPPDDEKAAGDGGESSRIIRPSDAL